MQIQAMVVREKGGPFLRETLELDEPRADEVVVRIVATGMCHSDLVIQHQHAPFPLPAVLGHEGAGIVERVGSAVSDISPGDHVVLSFNSCGSCRNCSSGHEAYCSDFGARNLAGRRADGSGVLHKGDEKITGLFFYQSSFASHALANSRNVVKVDKSAPLELLGPLGCGVQTGAGAVMNLLKPWPGASIVVFGAGGVGLSGVMAAKHLRCGRIVAVDTVASRLELARELGATHTINASDGNVGEELRAGGLLDFAFDTSGVPSSVEAAITSITRQGVCALVSPGNPGASITLPIAQFTGGKKIVSVVEGDATPKQFIPYLLDLFQNGELPFDKLVKFYDFDEINEAADDSQSGRTVKPIIRISTP